jgi:SAM-dependent methyltransferase/uncharacterized protein YbaR (Trm112 family)
MRIDTERLRCPVTKEPLIAKSSDAADTTSHLVGARSRIAYPVVAGIPLLMRSEMIVPAGTASTGPAPGFEGLLHDMPFYNAVASDQARSLPGSQVMSVLSPAIASSAAQRTTFPAPKSVWIDAVFDAVSQWDAYAHLSPVQGKRLLQLGGTGVHAIKFLLAGAAEAWLVSPMLEELRLTETLAREAGVADRLRCVGGVAEELPIADATFDGIYSGGCVHHTITERALPEAARVLRPGGRFAAVDPWRTLIYGVGTAIFGKREAGVSCRPLTGARIAPLFKAFDRARAVRHGALTRYPLIVLGKVGRPVPLDAAWEIFRVDDAISNALHLTGLASSVALLAERA